jgi:hypothetical protein
MNSAAPGGAALILPAFLRAFVIDAAGRKNTSSLPEVPPENTRYPVAFMPHLFWRGKYFLQK